MGGDREYQEVARHAHEGKLWPVEDSVVSLSDGAEAFRRMADGAQFGKLVIKVTP
jgi:NADPH:quinone reductase-like Zn-dependent oxidoreductase